MEETKEISLEENFQKLEQIVEVLSDPDIPLEKAFTSYSEGMALLKQCNDQIDRVEKKVMVLNGEGSLEELDGELE
ncbi:MAG: exodeoxyribonuclease VII small subunit [Lachnospiraceae bacterium]|nr:exodeoxyribonuclease VII small subunit [Lachnospiraceae bacterium]MBQ2101461.1 exodeoxyribonuclease VII small subunit [Lachnospiraceae bacterium]MBQ3906390.1 exodeoxyribonuclease VII small subunit [Lachnospiraceae bacterium]